MQFEGEICMRIDTVKFCTTLLLELIDKNVSYDIFEKALLRKQKELETKQETLDIKEVMLSGKCGKE